MTVWYCAYTVVSSNGVNDVEKFVDIVGFIIYKVGWGFVPQSHKMVQAHIVMSSADSGAIFCIAPFRS